MTLFDVYIAVDWSARNAPSRVLPSADAIWVGEHSADSSPDTTSAGPLYFRTRKLAERHIQSRLHAHLGERRRIFIGFDFAYAFPAGFAASLGYSGNRPWRWLWSELANLITDDPSNKNNRFQVASHLNARCGTNAPGPFWGCPAASTTLTLTSTMLGRFAYPYPVEPGYSLERLRLTEQLLPGVQPVWKLLGAGSVGSQALLGIPVVKRLRDDPALAENSRVWPFETGFTATPTPSSGPSVVHAEIWPGVVNDRLDPAHPIRDQAQVHAYVMWLAELDRRDQLGALFANGGDRSKEGNRRCIEEEGSILGAKPRQIGKPEVPSSSSRARYFPERRATTGEKDSTSVSMIVMYDTPNLERSDCSRSMISSRLPI